MRCESSPLFMGRSLPVVGLCESSHRIGLGRPALFQPTATLARLARAGCVLAGFSSLATGGRAAGGGFFFGVRVHACTVCRAWLGCIHKMWHACARASICLGMNA